MPKSRKNKLRGRKCKSSQKSRERQRREKLRERKQKQENELWLKMVELNRQMKMEGIRGTIGTPVTCPEDYWIEKK